MKKGESIILETLADLQKFSDKHDYKSKDYKMRVVSGGGFELTKL